LCPYILVQGEAAAVKQAVFMKEGEEG